MPLNKLYKKKRGSEASKVKNKFIYFSLLFFLKTDKNSTKEVKMTIKRARKRLHSVYGNAF